MRLGRVSLIVFSLFLLLLASCSNESATYGKIRLLSPAPGESVLTDEVRFIWNYTGSVKGYFRIYLGSEDGDFGLLADNLRSMEYSARLTAGVEYFWKVVYVEDGKVRVTSDTQSFYGNRPPTIPLLKYPGGGASDIPLNVTLQWYPSKDSSAVTYDVYMGVTENDLKRIATLLKKNEFDVHFLKPGTTYYWKVVAIDAGGARSESSVTVFTTTQNPYPFYLVSPQKGATGLIPEVTFRWQPAYDPDGDPVTYEFYLGVTDSAFVKYADSLTEPDFSLSLTYSTLYYWKVVAKDDRGGRRESEISSFMTDRSPLPPIPLTPENGESGVTLFAKFTWQKATDPDGDLLHYYFYLGEDPSHMTMTDLGLNKTSFVSDRLARGTTYYWKVVVTDGKGMYAETPIHYFTTTQFTASSSSNLTAGSFTTFFVDSTGGLWGGGRNRNGEVGVPGKNYYKEAVSIKLPGYGAWVTPSSGAGHTCATTTFHELYCWGVNDHGQCGVEDRENVPYPEKVADPSGSGWLSVDVGVNHTCAINLGNYLFCWGDNSRGEFGNGTTESSYTPVSNTTARWDSVAAGDNFTCGITYGEGYLYCWGDNTYGIMGSTGDMYDTPVGIDNSDNSRWLSISAGGDHVCGIDENYNLWCWGRNDRGQVGNSSFQTSVAEPYKVMNPQGKKWRFVTVNRFTSCAIDEANELWCWGDDRFSKLGDSGWGMVSTPHLVSNVENSGWKNVAIGLEHICAFDLSNNLWCWGRNTDGDGSFGQLLSGRGGDIYTRPVEVYYPSATTWLGVAAGADHSCAVNSAHQLWCWGNNMEGELGVVEPFSFASAEMPYMGMDFPVQVVNGDGTGWKEVSGGFYHTCALDLTGKVWCWGYDFTGSLGWSGGDSPTPVSGIDIRFSSISAGGFHNCGMTPDGVLYCWGNNFAGQLGTGDYDSGYVPRAVVNPEGAFWKQVCTGEFFTCALDVNGALWCWGDNRYGEVGRSAGGFYDTPQKIEVSGVSGWKRVACGMEHVCAIADNGSDTGDVYCWGRDDVRQAGAWSLYGYFDYPRLVAYRGVDIWAGGNHTCLLVRTYSGALVTQCWGDNSYGQLAVGYAGGFRYPVEIYDGGDFYRDMGLGLHHTCSVSISGHLFCWGGEVVSDSRSDESTYMSVGAGGYWVGFPVRAPIKY